MRSGDKGSFESLSFQFDNFDEFNQTVQGWSTDFRQVDRGVASVRLRHRMTPQINALDVQFSCSTASVGTSQPGHRTFGIVGKDTGCTWCGHDAESNHILRFDAHPEFFTVTPSDFVGRTLSIDETLLNALSERLGFHDFVSELDASRDLLEKDPTAVREFQRLYDRPMHSERDLLEVAEGIITLIGSSRDDQLNSWQRNSSRLLDDALDYIRMHARDAITVADICNALGVGYRRLDRAFKKHLGHGPKDSILAYRLNGVRDELRTSDAATAVSDVANGWGFWHLGDFARIYRIEFGELPQRNSQSGLIKAHAVASSAKTAASCSLRTSVAIEHI